MSAAASGDTVTVLTSRHRRLAKLLRDDGGADGYDNARMLDAATMPVANLDEIWMLTARLLTRPDCCVVRGELIDGTSATNIRRLLHMDRETGELPTLRDVPRRWLALDLEGVPRPAGTPPTDLAACAEAAMADFPLTIREASCVIQASAGHGLKTDVRLRAWMWLSRPTWGHELKRWLKDLPCDKSVFGAAQAIYTAGPVLAPGVADPVPERLLMLPGADVVDVPPPEALAPPPRPEPLPRSADFIEAQANRYVRRCLESAADKIGRATEGSRHPLIVAETCRLARFVETGLLTAEVLGRVVRDAAHDAGKDDEGELDAAIAYGLAHPWTAGPRPGDARDD